MNVGIFRDREEKTMEEKTKNRGDGSVDVIKIEYIDTLGISHKSYYQNNSLITEEVYYKIKKDATDTSYDVAKIDADEIIKLLDTI